MNFNKKISKKSFFVTGTDTGVGKTLFCSILMNKFHYNYWKPIQTGNKNDNDTIYIKKICKIPDYKSIQFQTHFHLKNHYHHNKPQNMRMFVSI